MEIAPDFFDYFEATATLLDKDKYVLLSIYYVMLLLRWIFLLDMPSHSFGTGISPNVQLMKDDNGCFFLEW